MEDRRDPVEDTERLERYLEWRRTEDRAARRRRRLRAVAVVLSLGVAAFLVATWSMHGSRPAPDRLALEPPATEPVRTDGVPGAPAPPPGPVRPPSDRPGDAVSVPAPPPSSGPPARRQRPGQRRVAVARGQAPRADVAASPASTPPAPAPAAPPVTTAPIPDAPPVVAETSPSVAQGTVQTPPPPGATPPPAPGVTAVPATPPAAADTSRAQCGRVFGDGSGAAADQLKSRGEAAADCVGGWVKGEAREFRDGVKRQVGELAAGLGKVRLGVSRLRSRLGGSE